MATENQAKAADLLRMLRSSGLDTLADELQNIVAEAWYEGRDSIPFDEDDFSNGIVVNPYADL